MSVLDVLDTLSTTASTNDKKDIIVKSLKEYPVLRSVFFHALNPYIVYGIKKIPEYKTKMRLYTIGQAIGILEDFSSRKYTGNAAIKHLTHILESLDRDDAIVVERIIQRDLRCGVADALINAAVGEELIPTFDVMLCHKDTSGIDFTKGAIIQEKGDGSRVILHYDGEKVTAYSRNGKVFDFGDHFLGDATDIMEVNDRFDGELLCFKNGKVLDRKTTNGILSKAQKGTITKEEISMVRMMAWDIVDLTSTIDYKDRFEELTHRLHNTENIFLCPSEIINSEEEAQEFYLRMRKDGKEGAIVKTLDGKYESKRVKTQGKMKNVSEGDFRITAIIPGTGKYDGMMGAFEYSTDDGLVVGRVGTGFSDDDREKYFDHSYLGKVVTIAYNEKIKDKKTGVWSLFLPRFIEIRFDRDTTNTFEELE